MIYDEDGARAVVRTTLRYVRMMVRAGKLDVRSDEMEFERTAKKLADLVLGKGAMGDTVTPPEQRLAYLLRCVDEYCKATRLHFCRGCHIVLAEREQCYCERDD